MRLRDFLDYPKYSDARQFSTQGIRPTLMVAGRSGDVVEGRRVLIIIDYRG